MGELAYFSTVNQDILYREFGVDAELLIDHAWGLEPCGMKEIKAYKPSTNSISEGQVLSCPYPYDKARIIVMEMADSLVLQLTDKGLVTDSLTLDVGYDRENCDSGKYKGPVLGALACMAGCFYTGCKKLMQAHKYFACGSLICMGMAIYSGHKIAPKKKKAEKPEK